MKQSLLFDLIKAFDFIEISHKLNFFPKNTVCPKSFYLLYKTGLLGHTIRIIGRHSEMSNAKCGRERKISNISK